MFRHRGSVSPIPQSGLSLWLKADAGVSKFSYNYASQIVISGTSTPSFAGTYIADGVPSYDYGDGQINGYTLTGPTGKSISWDSNNQSYLLSSNSETGSFSSGDGETWTSNTFVSQIVITGFTGVYSGANGTYNGDGNNFSRVGGGFIISLDELIHIDTELVIATAPANYSGSWTPTTFISGVTLYDAGTSDVNGTYTRGDTLNFEDTFYASGGRTISYPDNYYKTTNDEYRCTNGFLEDWVVELGDSPEPGGTIIQTARTIGSATSTTTTRPTGSVSGVVTTSTVNTDNVTSWADQSGNGRNVSGGGETIPSYEVISGKQFISFGAYANLNNSGNPIWVDGYEIDFGTIIAVARFPSSSSNFSKAQLFFHEPTISFWRGYPNGDGLMATADDSNNAESALNLSNNTNYLVEMIFDVGGGFCKVYLNGSENGSIETNGNNGGNSFSIGGGDDASNIAEIIIYKRVLTTPERQQVEAYLNTKYAIY